MADVFISYSSLDRDWVHVLADGLKQYGLDVWFDPEIKPGQDYRQIIRSALDSAKCVIVVWSEKSAESVWVQSEASQALSRNILIPLVHQNARIPMPFDAIQSADMEGWDGDILDKRFQSLLSGISLHCKLEIKKIHLQIKFWNRK